MATDNQPTNSIASVCLKCRHLWHHPRTQKFVDDIIVLLQLVVTLPLLCWLLLFSVIVKEIPNSIRPQIDVTSLPRADHWIFGYYPTEELAKITSPPLDILAAIPYSIHFLLPLLFLMHAWRKDKLQIFSFSLAFGLLNAAAVVFQIALPTAPPWYYNEYGTTPASYDMPGQPAGLARVDELLGIRFFHNLYGSSPIVFGSFPSLHAAWPALITLYSPLFGIPVVYTALVWSAAIYLQHHYFVDVVIGGAMSLMCFLIVSKLLPLHRIAPPRVLVLMKKQHPHLFEEEVVCNNDEPLSSAASPFQSDRISLLPQQQSSPLSSSSSASGVWQHDGKKLGKIPPPLSFSRLNRYSSFSDSNPPSPLVSAQQDVNGERINDADIELIGDVDIESPVTPPSDCTYSEFAASREVSAASIVTSSSSSSQLAADDSCSVNASSTPIVS